MLKAYYTYRVRVASHERVQVEKWDSQYQSLGEPDGILRYQDKLTEEIRNLIQVTRKNELNDSSQSRLLGEALFDILFDDALCRDFVNFYNQVVYQEKQLLRIELDIDEQKMPEVASLPWEFMCLPQKANSGTTWLGTANNLVFSRRRAQWIAAQPIQLEIHEKLRIALVISAPKNLAPVEYKTVQTALKKLAREQPDRVELLPAVSRANPKSIDAVLAKQPHIFHLIGHGRLENEDNQTVGQLALMDDFNEAMWVDADYFSGLFNRHRSGVVLLQACEGGVLSGSKAFVGVASRVVQQNIPVVIAMQYEVSNITASRFAHCFYGQLAQGNPVDVAVQEGRYTIALSPTQYRKRDFATPAIFMRVQDGYLFRWKQEQTIDEEEQKSGKGTNLLTQTATQNQPNTPILEKQSEISRTLHRDALVVGINQYNSLEPLKAPARDAEAIAQLLEKYGGFRVRRLPASYNNGALQVDPNKPVKMSELKAAVAQLFNPEGNNIADTALLFFSGHGLRDSFGGVTEGYLASSDADPTEEQWGLSLQLLQRSLVEQQIIWLDCCYSGELLNFLELESLEKNKSRFFLTASREFETAHENTTGQQGILTEILLKGLNPRKILNGEVTNRTLIEFLNQELKNKSIPQRPVWNNSDTEILLTSKSLLTDEREQTVVEIPIKPTYKTYRDWDGAIDVTVFYGRTDELIELKRWILEEHCRAITILGTGGTGKTALATKLAEQIEDRFEYLIWRSLRDSPPLDELLTDLLKVLSNQQLTTLPSTVEGKISLIIDYLQKHRCLILLDNVESIMQSGTPIGHYRAGYEDYGIALRRFAETRHQSCVVGTSREKSQVFASLEGKAKPVRCLQLIGLEAAAAGELLKAKGFLGTESRWEELVERYGGNPLALNIVATIIIELFDGNISEFLDEGISIFGDVQDLVSQQFNRLSILEKDIMYWLAVNREPISFPNLRSDLMTAASRPEFVGAMFSLVGRSLVEKSAGLFLLQSVIMEYVTNRLIEQVVHEVSSREIRLFNSHALLKAQVKDYVRETQARLIIRPVIDRLTTILGSQDSLESQLIQILSIQREHFPHQPGYVGGNTLNMLSQFKSELGNYDFSHLAVWQAYLQGIILHHVNFTCSDLSKSVFTQAFGTIFSVAFSLDGKLLATGDAKSEIHLWKVANGQKLLMCRGHNSRVYSVAFSPDSQTLASASEDQTVRLWNVHTGQCLKFLQGHTKRVWSVAFSPNGEFFASASEDQTVRLWNVRTGQCVNILQGHTDIVSSVAFSPDGEILASSSSDQTVRLWNFNTGLCLRTLQGHIGRVRSVSFSPNGRTLASSSGDQTLKLWDVRTGQCFRTLQGHTNIVLSVAFSPNGETLASGSGDQTLKLWDVRTGQCLKSLQEGMRSVWSVAFSPDGETLASSSGDQTLRLWDIRTDRCLNTVQGNTNISWAVALSPDGKTLASGGEDQILRLWDTNTGQCLGILRGHTDIIWSVAFSPDGQTIASASDDRTVRLWDVRTGHCRDVFQGHTNWVGSVAFSPDGQTIASASEDKTIRLWDVCTGQCLNILQGHTSRVRSIAFSSTGETLASGSNDQTLALWDVRTGQCLRTLQGHNDIVWSVAFSPDGQTIASASDQTLALWDVRTGQCLRTLQGHNDIVWSVAFSPDGQTIASGSSDRTLKLWDVRTGQCLRTLQGHTSWVWSIAFNHDSLILVSCSEDETIKIWNVQTGECTRTLRAPRPYEGINIKEVTGLTEAEKVTLKVLGAVEN